MQTVSRKHSCGSPFEAIVVRGCPTDQHAWNPCERDAALPGRPVDFDGPVAVLLGLSLDVCGTFNEEPLPPENDH